MTRRDFLHRCGLLAAATTLPRWTWAASLPADIKIARVVGFNLVSKRPKLVGKNSRLGVHGDSATDRMVRLFTDSGIEGVGCCRADEKTLASILGRNPFDYFQAAEPGMHSPLGAGTMPLWDLAGKALGKPVYRMLGAKGNRKVPAYDGSIYFTDLLPQYANRWSDRFKEEIDAGLKRGHLAFKIKIGRGAKWMPTEEGFDRDKAVVALIRDHAGPNVLLGVDANNGYDLARAQRFLRELPDANLAFVEAFPENIEENRELKEFIQQQKLKTLVADGETQQALEPFKPFMDARVIDIFQGDMNHFGIEGILREASWAAKQKLLVGPHNWGSLLGFYQILHVGAGIPNFYRAENDPLATNVLVAEGYTLNQGRMSIPDAPGFGLGIDEAAFASTVKPLFDLRL